MTLWQGIFLEQSMIFADVLAALFKAAKVSVEVALGLVGMLCLWLGLFQVAQKAGMINSLAKFLSPLFQKLMPEIPQSHPAIGSVTMNLAANMLGLDNAATPLGLKAMKDLQTLNPTPDTATNAQILFLVLNTASITLIPISVFLYRAQFGAHAPAEVFLPILLSSASGTVAGVLVTAWLQKLSLWNRVVWGYAAFIALVMGLLVSFVVIAPLVEWGARSAIMGNALLLTVIAVFILAGVKQKINVYETFVEGAKEGFQVAITIIPFLVAMLIAIALFRASGMMDLLLNGLASFITFMGMNADFTPALPVAVMKSLSGSGARALMIETFQHYGVDSFPSYIASIIQGSSETTFYVLAVYFGSVGIRKERYALWVGLLADFVSVVTAIFIAYLFYSPIK